MNVQTELQPADFSFFHKNKTLWENKTTSTQSVQKTLGGASGDWYACNKHGWAVQSGPPWHILSPLRRWVMSVRWTCSRQGPRTSTYLPDITTLQAWLCTPHYSQTPHMHFLQPCADTGIFYIPFDKLSSSFSNSQQLCSDIHFKSPTLIESKAFESEISMPAHFLVLAKQGLRGKPWKLTFSHIQPNRNS